MPANRVTPSFAIPRTAALYRAFPALSQRADLNTRKRPTCLWQAGRLLFLKRALTES